MKMLCTLLAILGIAAGAIVAYPAGKQAGRREASGAKPESGLFV